MTAYLSRRARTVGNLVIRVGLALHNQLDIQSCRCSNQSWYNSNRIVVAYISGMMTPRFRGSVSY